MQTIKDYLTACHAIDQEYTTLAYPATICMDCQAAEITDDESSVQMPKKTYRETDEGTESTTLDVE